jgi:hypothetical protein
MDNSFLDYTVPLRFLNNLKHSVIACLNQKRVGLFLSFEFLFFCFTNIKCAEGLVFELRFNIDFFYKKQLT